MGGAIEPTRGQQLLTVAEAAAALALSKSLVYQLVLSGELESVKVRRCRRVPVDALNSYVKELRDSSR